MSDRVTVYLVWIRVGWASTGATMRNPAISWDVRTSLTNSSVHPCMQTSRGVIFFSRQFQSRKWLPGIRNRMSKDRKQDFARGAASVVTRKKRSQGRAAVCLG